MSTTARIDELRKKFEENPRRYFAPLANEYRKSGDLAQAIALCREHLPKQPGHMSGYIVFGQALYESGDLSEARTVFEQALALDPENLIALANLGDIARDGGDAASARRWYGRVLDADPRNEEIAARMAALQSGQTPASSPAVTTAYGVTNYGTLSRLTETPAADMPPIGLGAVPTPDSMLRAVDVNAFRARTRSHSPLDLDSIDDPSMARQSTAPTPNPSGDEGDTDPFGFPTMSRPNQSSDSADPAVAATGEGLDVTPGAASSSASATEEEFEEGLMAPVWPDTTDLVARVVTPRSVTPQPVRPIAGLEDAASAFGREEDDPTRAPVSAASASAASATPLAVPAVNRLEVPTEPADGLMPSSDSLVEDGGRAEVEALDLIDEDFTASATSHDIALDTRSAEDESSDYEFGEMIAGSAVPATDETSEDVEAFASYEARFVVSEETPVDAMMAMADEAEPDVEEDRMVVSPVVADNMAVHGSGNEVDRDAPTEPATGSPDIEPVESTLVTADAAPDEATIVSDLDQSALTEDAVSADVLAASAPSKGADVGNPGPLPWLAVADVAEEGQPHEEPSEPGLEEIVETFAEDARSAGEERPLTIAAMDTVTRTPSAGTPAFVTETMAELLVAQGFIGRAVDVYEELVRRRPNDAVLTARLSELKATSAAGDALSPAALETPESDTAVNEADDVVAVVSMFAEVVHGGPGPEAVEEPDTLESIDAYIDIAAEVEAEPVAETTRDDAENEKDVDAVAAAFAVPPAAQPEATHWLGADFSIDDASDATTDVLSAASASTSDHTAAISSPLGTPVAPPAVTPYALPAVEQVSPTSRTARAWFASLAARRVSRRTPVSTTPISTTSVAPDEASVARPAIVDRSSPVGDEPVEAPIAAAPAGQGTLAVESVTDMPMSDAAPIDSAAVESEPVAEGLSLLFGADDLSEHDDTAARALADAFAPVSPEELQTGETLDFEYARSTPPFSPALSPATPMSTPHARAQVPASSAPPSGGGNAGFTFDKFFPDPAVRGGTPASASTAAPSSGTPPASAPETPVTDDLAQFSDWLKGLGNK